MLSKEIFPIRLTEIREENALTRQVAADSLGITRASLEYYEKGKRFPDFNVLVRIAQFYKCSTDYLLGLSDKPATEESLQFMSTYMGLDVDIIEGIHNSNANWNIEEINTSTKDFTTMDIEITKIELQKTLLQIGEDLLSEKSLELKKKTLFYNKTKEIISLALSDKLSEVEIEEIAENVVYDISYGRWGDTDFLTSNLFKLIYLHLPEDLQPIFGEIAIKALYLSTMNNIPDTDSKKEGEPNGNNPKEK